MSSSSVARSFAITLAIAIVIIRPYASGFVIDRINNETTSSTHMQSTDLSSDESFQLQVKDDLRRQNDIKISKNSDLNKTTKGSSIKIDRIKEALDMKSANAPRAENKHTSTEIRTTTENTKIPTISSDTVEVFDSVEDVTEFKSSKSNDGFSTKPQELEQEQNVIALEKTIKAITKISSEPTVTTELSTVSDQIATDSDSTADKSTRQNTALSIPDNETMDTVINNRPEMTTKTPEMLTSTMVSIAEDVDIVTSIDPKTDSSPTNSETLHSSTTSSKDAGTTTEIHSTFPDSDIVETTTDFNTTTIEPSWRKYTTIVRKRVTSSDDITQTSKIKDETMNAETSNSHANYEKPFNVTPISLLEKLKTELPSNINKPSVSSEMMSDESEKTTVAIKLTKLSPNTVKTTETKRTETVQTKRGGYLDYSEKAPTTVITDIKIDKEKKYSNFETTVDDVETTESESANLKKVGGSESHSQMAEDAIQEELMKEEALNNHQENVNRYRDEKNENEEVKSLEETDILGTTQPGLPLIRGEDSLSVQPIHHERTKTTLYTISPNYKPMKKIDVQPAKPFVRDPDDNSWRNESISSLGIVFKPKNSSISFKEVLKNKTHTELNNIQEKDAKSDLPDLRVRLEKIAEVRKSKKKKINKDGEEIYTDYEEDKSAESTSTPLLDSISSGLVSAELSKVTSSTPVNTEMDIQDITSPMSTWTQLEANKAKTTSMMSQALFKSLGLDSLDYLTTAKPKKFYNIAEYYDTTDEYDADYITMSKLDLKKFTVPPVRKSPAKETHHIEPLLSKPIKTYFPERKPTVQYFPPREPQKVNFNNVDKDFERKINLFKEHPKIEPQPPFVTVSPLAIATEKPPPEKRPELPVDMRAYIRSEMRPDSRPNMRPDVRPDFMLVNPPHERPDIIRPTVKPTDFSMYTPADLSRNYYMTNAPRTTEPHDAYVIHEGSLNRGSYVIKHYKDLLNAAAVKDSDDERPNYMQVTESPREVTVAEIERGTHKSVDYDSDAQFRKDVLNRFVDNFNQNSERFKVDFPILYNNSVVHRPADGHGRDVASSRTFLKRLYNNEGTATKSNAPLKKPCEPHCEVTVELSPAYELHYYVPEQEEKEEMEPRSATASPAPYRYSL